MVAIIIAPVGAGDAAGVTTIFNPAPAEAFPDTIYPLCDYIVPNETEAAALVGFALSSLDDVRRAGDVLIERGAKSALITLGARGLVFHTPGSSTHIPVVSNGPAIDATGAGDAFVAGFAATLSNAMERVQAVRFGCATAGIAVMRRGTALQCRLWRKLRSYWRNPVSPRSGRPTGARPRLSPMKK